MSKEYNIPSFSAEDIERYQKGLMSSAERHALEKAALSDPFLADALEGFMDTPVDLKADMEELKERLGKRLEEKTRLIPIAPAKSNLYYLRIAAAVIVLAGAGWFFYQFSQDKQKGPIALNDKKDSVADTTNLQPSPTASPVNNNGSFSNIDTSIIKPGKIKDPVNYHWEHDRSSAKDDITEKTTIQRDTTAKPTANPALGRKDEARQFEIAADKKENQAKKTPVNTDSEVVVSGMGMKKMAAPSARGTIDYTQPVSAPQMGWNAYQQYLKDSLRLPSNYSRKTPAEFVELNFEVDASGKPYNFNVISSFSKASAEEARRLVSQGPLWKPGKANLKIYF